MLKANCMQSGCNFEFHYFIELSPQLVYYTNIAVEGVRSVPKDFLVCVEPNVKDSSDEVDVVT